MSVGTFRIVSHSKVDFALRALVGNTLKSNFAQESCNKRFARNFSVLAVAGLLQEKAFSIGSQLWG